MLRVERLSLFIMSLLLLITITACSTNNDQYADLYRTVANTVNYRTAAAERADLTRDATLELEAVYTSRLTLNSPADAVSCELKVKNGDKVAKGEVIAYLFFDISFADVEEKRLAFESAQERYKIQMEEAEAILGRSGELTRMELEYTSTRTIAYLENEYKSILARYEEGEELLAPFNAVVNMLHTQSGKTLALGAPIVTIANQDSLVLFSNSGSQFFGYGLPITIEYGKTGERKTMTGRVSSTDAVSQANGLVPVNKLYVTPDEDVDPELLVNIKASAQIVYARDAILVPHSAVSSDKGGSFVNLLDEAGNIHKRYITKGVTGGNTGAFFVEVLTGLDAGQTVLLP